MELRDHPVRCSISLDLLLDPVSATVCLVVAALKNMKRHKAPGLSALSAEMIQATEDIGTQWLLDLCNGIVKEGTEAVQVTPFRRTLASSP